MNNMSDLLLLPDLKTIEPPQENESDMMFKVEATLPPYNPNTLKKIIYLISPILFFNFINLL